METVETAVIESLISRAETLAAIADAPTARTEPLELKELRAQLAGLEQLGYNIAIESAKNNLRIQIENLTHKFKDTSNELDSNRDLLLDVFADLDFWTQLPPPKRQRVYRQLVERVVICNGVVEIVQLKV